MANHMGSDPSRRKWFELMLPHIPQCGDDEDRWITGRALEAAAGVTEHQRSAGVNWGRKNHCPGQQWAFVSGRRGYRFVATARQAAPFVIQGYKSASTLLLVRYLGAQKPLMNRLVAEGKLPPSAAKAVEKGLNRVLEDIEDLRAAI